MSSKGRRDDEYMDMNIINLDLRSTPKPKPQEQESYMDMSKLERSLKPTKIVSSDKPIRYKGYRYEMPPVRPVYDILVAQPILTDTRAPFDFKDIPGPSNWSPQFDHSRESHPDYMAVEPMSRQQSNQPKPAKKTEGNTAFLRAARSGNLEKVLEFINANVDINTANSNGLNALHLASKDGYYEVVEELLNRGANVDAATKKGNTALHIASLAGQEKVVKLLVEHGASVNVQSQSGFTPLYMAAQENHETLVRYLLNNGANQSLATEDGFTPLAVAMQQGHDKVVTELLENDTRGKVRLPALHIAAKKDDCKAAALLLQSDHNPDITSKSGFTPLHIASHYGNDAIASLLLAKGADVNYAAKHNITPLHVAAKWGRNNMVILLLDKGGSITAKTRDGLTPLHCAARSGHEEVVDTLLQRHAPITAKTKNGLAPLHMASQGDHVDAARVLLAHRAPVDDVTVDYLTALHVASHCGHVSVAKLLLERKADANARALNGFTPLHIACKKNRQKIVELLLKHGASIQATTESGLSPLHVASFMGCMNIVIYLIQCEANPDVATVRGETPLHLAARANQTDIIRILLRNGAQVDAKARESQTPFHIASRIGNADIVMLLLQHGADVDSATKDLYTSLHIAAKEDQEEVTQVLLENNASIEATTKKGFTPLHIAAKYGRMKIATLLLQRGARVDPQGKNGVTPLHVATHYNHQSIALLLLDKNASPHATAKNGHTPLHIAAKKNQMDIAGMLLEFGADAGVESKAGFTPLHLAAQEGHVEMTSLLLDNKASVDHASKNGLTALHLCAQEDRVDVASILVNSGANVNAATKAGYTPLHIASHFGQLNMVRFLIVRKAKVDATTNNGYTALHQAAQQGNSTIVAVLLDNGASPDAKNNQNQTALYIAQKLGYISVVEVLKNVTATKTVNGPVDEKYKVVAPETMQENFMSDSEDEGGDELAAMAATSATDRDSRFYMCTASFLPYQQLARDDAVTDQSYRYLTVDEMKSLGDDSLPLDTTKEDRYDTTAGMDESISPQHFYTQMAAAPASDNIDVSKAPVVQAGKLRWRSFLVSFLVDARGGAMRGCRHSGVRVIVPPQSATMPTRVTCRYVRRDKPNHPPPPPLMEGEALASRILELAPVGVKFLGPVIIEVPHFASLRGNEREIVVLRSDNGETWREHTVDSSSDTVQDILSRSFDKDGNQIQLDEPGRITSIVTSDFPHYFAIVSRVRQEVHAIGPEGGMVSSSVVPQVQAVFPQGALTKKIKVGLQAQPIPSELTASVLGNCVAVSPIVTIEPRRRKFHKPITLTLPVPQAANKGMINQYSGDAPTLRLLCSITGGTSRAQWEDVTGSTPLTFVKECVSFTTTVSARFWLMDIRDIVIATKKATELYREATHVPFMAKFVVFAKRIDNDEARLRVFCMTDDKEDKTLECQEHFTEVAKSRDVEVPEGKKQLVELSGNLISITKSGDHLRLGFNAFQENRLPFTVRVKDSHADPIGRMLFFKEQKPVKTSSPSSPICVLNIVLPDGMTSDPEFLDSPIRKYSFLKDKRTHRSELRFSDISNLIGEDWVLLSSELGISSSDSNVIKAEYPESVAKQALTMLRIWHQQNENKASTNILEKALLRIGREDIVRECILSQPYGQKDNNDIYSSETLSAEIIEDYHKRNEVYKTDDNETKYTAEEKVIDDSELKSVQERKLEIEQRLVEEQRDRQRAEEKAKAAEEEKRLLLKLEKEAEEKGRLEKIEKQISDDMHPIDTNNAMNIEPIEPETLTFQQKRLSFEKGLSMDKLKLDELIKETEKQMIIDVPDAVTPKKGEKVKDKSPSAEYSVVEKRQSLDKTVPKVTVDERATVEIKSSEERNLSFEEKRRSFEREEKLAMDILNDNFEEDDKLIEDISLSFEEKRQSFEKEPDSVTGNVTENVEVLIQEKSQFPDKNLLVSEKVNQEKSKLVEQLIKDEECIADKRRDSELLEGVTLGLGKLEVKQSASSEQNLLSPKPVKTPPPTPAEKELEETWERNEKIVEIKEHQILDILEKENEDNFVQESETRISSEPSGNIVESVLPCVLLSKHEVVDNETVAVVEDEEPERVKIADKTLKNEIVEQVELTEELINRLIQEENEKLLASGEFRYNYSDSDSDFEETPKDTFDVDCLKSDKMESVDKNEVDLSVIAEEKSSIHTPIEPSSPLEKQPVNWEHQHETDIVDENVLNLSTQLESELFVSKEPANATDSELISTDRESDSHPVVTTPTLERRKMLGGSSSQRLSRNDRPPFFEVVRKEEYSSDEDIEPSDYTVTEPREKSPQRKVAFRLSSTEDDLVYPGQTDSEEDSEDEIQPEEEKHAEELNNGKIVENGQSGEKTVNQMERKFERMASVALEEICEAKVEGEFQKIVSQLSHDEVNECVDMWNKNDDSSYIVAPQPQGMTEEYSSQIDDKFQPLVSDGILKESSSPRFDDSEKEEHLDYHSKKQFWQTVSSAEKSDSSIPIPKARNNSSAVSKKDVPIAEGRKSVPENVYASLEHPSAVSRSTDAETNDEEHAASTEFPGADHATSIVKTKLRNFHSLTSCSLDSEKEYVARFGIEKLAFENVGFSEDESSKAATPTGGGVKAKALFFEQVQKQSSTSSESVNKSENIKTKTSSLDEKIRSIHEQVDSGLDTTEKRKSGDMETSSVMSSGHVEDDDDQFSLNALTPLESHRTSSFSHGDSIDNTQSESDITPEDSQDKLTPIPDWDSANEGPIGVSECSDANKYKTYDNLLDIENMDSPNLSISEFSNPEKMLVSPYEKIKAEEFSEVDKKSVTVGLLSAEYIEKDEDKSSYGDLPVTEDVTISYEYSDVTDDEVDTHLLSNVSSKETEITEETINTETCVPLDEDKVQMKDENVVTEKAKGTETFVPLDEEEVKLVAQNLINDIELELSTRPDIIRNLLKNEEYDQDEMGTLIHEITDEDLESMSADNEDSSTIKKLRTRECDEKTNDDQVKFDNSLASKVKLSEASPVDYEIIYEQVEEFNTSESIDFDEQQSLEEPEYDFSKKEISMSSPDEQKTTSHESYDASCIKKETSSSKKEQRIDETLQDTSLQFGSVTLTAVNQTYNEIFDKKKEPKIVTRNAADESTSLQTKDHKSAADSSSSESHYHSFDQASSDNRSSSRPCSSDVEALLSCTIPGTTGSSDYETAASHQTSLRSHEFCTAVSSISSRESMKSIDSESSGNLGSAEVSVDKSETLVPSLGELDCDVDFTMEPEKVDDRPPFVEPYDKEIPVDIIRGTFFSLAAEYSPAYIHESRGDYEENQFSNLTCAQLMKFPDDHKFNYTYTEMSCTSKSSDNKELNNLKLKFKTETDNSSLHEIIDEKIISLDEATSTSSITDGGTSMQTIVEVSRTESDKLDNSGASEQSLTMSATSEQLSISSEFKDDCEFNKNIETNTLPTHKADEAATSVLITTSTFDEGGQQTFATQITSIYKSDFHTDNFVDIETEKLNLDAKTSQKVNDELISLSQRVPNITVTSEAKNELNDQKKPSVPETKTNDNFKKVITVSEKPAEVITPDDDSFELIEKPDLIDDFVVIEEVAKEASEHDAEGKAIKIEAKRKIHVVDDDVEIQPKMTTVKLTSVKYYGDVGAVDATTCSFPIEESSTDKKIDDGTPPTDEEMENYEREIKEGKKWIEMQFQEDSEVATPYEYELEFERMPLEDIKEEDTDDLHSSKVGSMGSQISQSIGSLGSMKQSLSSTPDYDILAGRKYFTKSGEHDDVSMSSLQEFERLEQLMALESLKSKSSSSQDSISSSAGSKKYGRSIGDDVSVSSLKEFERLESVCAEAEKVKERARIEEICLSQIEEGHESQASESESCETLEKSYYAESDNEDYDKKMFEIDEIIRQAQSNVDKLVDADRLDKTESLGRGDSYEEVARIPDLELDQPLPPGPPFELYSGKKYIESISISSPLTVSTDSLEVKSAMKGNDLLSISTDSLEGAKLKHNIATDSLDNSGVDSPKSGQELNTDASSSSDKENIPKEVPREGSPHHRDILSSPESVDATSSATTYATYHNESDSIMSSSFTSIGSNTMVSSTENLESMITNYSNWFEGSSTTQITESSTKGEETHVTTQVTSIAPEITKVVYKGPDARTHFEEKIEEFQPGQYCSQVEHVNPDGTVRITKVIETRTVVTTEEMREIGSKVTEEKHVFERPGRVAGKSESMTTSAHQISEGMTSNEKNMDTQSTDVTNTQTSKEITKDNDVPSVGVTNTKTSKEKEVPSVGREMDLLNRCITFVKKQLRNLGLLHDENTDIVEEEIPAHRSILIPYANMIKDFYGIDVNHASIGVFISGQDADGNPNEELVYIHLGPMDETYRHVASGA